MDIVLMVAMICLGLVVGQVITLCRLLLHLRDAGERARMSSPVLTAIKRAGEKREIRFELGEYQLVHVAQSPSLDSVSVCTRAGKELVTVHLSHLHAYPVISVGKRMFVIGQGWERLKPIEIAVRTMMGKCLLIVRRIENGE